MARAIYLECNSGISGDMFVAAMLDLGADEKVLMEALDSLPVDGFSVEISRVKKSGLDACDFDVQLDKAHENHDHDMEYLHGHSHEHKNHHSHGHHENHHEHHGEHTHEHRGLTEVLEIIEKAKITVGARKLAIEIFEIIGAAEAKAHGTTREQVHFHEVGAVDSIVDIVAAAVCVDNLGIDKVYIPQINEGQGTVRCQHGILPVPVPAVSNIVANNHLDLHIMEEQGEFVTPTGAAIAAAIRTHRKLPETFTIGKVGLGAGKRSYNRPSILRAMEIQEESIQEQDVIYRLECNVDDCTGEALGYAMEQLLKEGARDVHYIPVYMKKNRPAYELVVICDQEHIAIMEQVIFRETTTIGIRRVKMERTILKRKIATVQTPYGEVQVKISDFPAGRRCYPEYDSVAALCQKHHMGYPQMYQAILAEILDEEEDS